MLPRTTILVVVPDPAQSGSSLHWIRPFFTRYQFSFCVCDIRPAWFGVSLPSGLKWLVASGCFIQIVIVFCGNILYVLMIWFYAYFFYWLVTFSNLCYWSHGLSFFFLQSDRFFNALKGHGALSRLVILPFESHGYSARESIMHVLWETDRWLQNYCVNGTSKVDSVSEADSENKTLSASGGSAAREGLNPEGLSSLPRSLLW